MSRLERFGRLLDYDAWATDLALKAIESVPAERRSNAQFDRAIRVAAHVQVGRWVWLERLHGRVVPQGTDLFPAWSIEKTRTEAAAMDDAWRAFIDRLADHDLDNEMEYSAMDGTRYASALLDVLTHVFNHGTYHRGQIARLATECGGLRHTTDFIAFTRRAL